MKNRKMIAAFTLVEVMVVLAVLTIIVSLSLLLCNNVTRFFGRSVQDYKNIDQYMNISTNIQSDLYKANAISFSDSCLYIYINNNLREYKVCVDSVIYINNKKKFSCEIHEYLGVYQDTPVESFTIKYNIGGNLFFDSFYIPNRGSTSIKYVLYHGQR